MVTAAVSRASCIETGDEAPGLFAWRRSKDNSDLLGLRPTERDHTARNLHDRQVSVDRIPFLGLA